jgi:hypothetical protein
MPPSKQRHSYVPGDENKAGSRNSTIPRGAECPDQDPDDRLRLEALGQHAPGKSKVIKLPEWPPKLSDKRIEYLTKKATTWALAHSFVLVPPDPDYDPYDPKYKHAPIPPPTRAQPAPLSLFPTPFPRRLYQQANSLQNMLNALYMRVSLDWEFLDKVIGQSVRHVDEFQGWLYHFWKRNREEVYAVSLFLYTSNLKLIARIVNLVFSDQTTCYTRATQASHLSYVK